MRRTVLALEGMIVAAATLGFAVAAAAYTDARGVNSAPGRTLNGTPLGRTIDEQGGAVGNLRRSVANQSMVGWFAEYNGTVFDDEVTAAAARTGAYGWRLSNWYRTGIINALATPWLSRPAGESGTRDYGRNGEFAATNRIRFSFWFRTGATALPPVATDITFSPDDGVGSRWGGFVVLNDRFAYPNGATGPVVRIYSIPDAVHYGYADSPMLHYGQWYRLDWQIVFVDGNGLTGLSNANDVVTLDVYDAALAPVWHADQTTPWPDAGIPGYTNTGITTWEMASWNAGTNGYGISSLQIRLNRAADTNHPNPGYSATRPSGFYIDDFAMEAGARSYATSFEPFSYAEDLGFATQPGRALNGTPVNRSVLQQGGLAGDLRGTNTYNGGSKGWFAGYSGTKYDEEVTRAAARSGRRGLRVGNWYRDGMINALCSPWAATPAGEPGTRDHNGGGVTAEGLRFGASFWFRSADTNAGAPGQSFVSLSPDDGLGTRWGGRLDLRDDGTLRVRWLSQWRDYGTDVYGFSDSPALTYGAWYRVDLEQFYVEGNGATAPGTHNDIVRVRVYNAVTSLVWSVDQNTPVVAYGEYDDLVKGTNTGITTWEDAYWESAPYAVNSLQMRINRGTDLNTGTGYLDPRPGGFFFDEFRLEVGNNTYWTSFEPGPSPGMLLLVLEARERKRPASSPSRAGPRRIPAAHR